MVRVAIPYSIAMPTYDNGERSIDYVLAIVGAREDKLAFLTAIGSRFNLTPAEIAADPTVALTLGEMPRMPGWKMVFHASGYDSELARADASIIVLGPDVTCDAEVAEALPIPHAIYFVDANRTAAFAQQPDDAVSVPGVLASGAGVFDALKLASKDAISRAGEPSGFLPLPQCVREGLHRHDRSADPTLAPDEAPALGRHVKVQINLREPLESANQPGQYVNWLAMGGTVTNVEGPDVVDVSLVATTDGAPAEFGGHWRGRLVRTDGWQFPWTLRALDRVG